jgi:hypothetical protein
VFVLFIEGMLDKLDTLDIFERGRDEFEDIEET